MAEFIMKANDWLKAFKLSVIYYDYMSFGYVIGTTF